MALTRWIDLTSPEIGKLNSETTVALIPFGAVEQHGPHLPVGVDGFIVEALVARPELRDVQSNVVLLPVQWLGWSPEHSSFQGTLSARAETLLTVWRELCLSLVASGIHKFVFLNGHGGQPEILRILSRELRVDQGALAVVANWFGFGAPEAVNTLSESERKWGIHGGAIETAIMRCIDPKSVREEKATTFANAGAGHHSAGKCLSPQGPTPWAWMAEDLNPQGALGDAKIENGATAELGEALLAHTAKALARLIEDLATTPRQDLLRLQK